MAFSASDVGKRIDVLINGEGYRFIPTDLGTRLFGRQSATYSFSPTFVERTNVQGDYGDNQQDFWLTVSDRDWSLGEQQKYYRADEIGSRRYYNGTALDVSIPGEVTNNQNTNTVSGLSSAIAQNGMAMATTVYLGSTTNLYSAIQTGAATSLGAHGLSATPARFGIAVDGNAVYLSSSASGVGVRKYESAAFSTFSATPADSLAFLNNTLYGVNNLTNTFFRYDTAGVATTLYTWKQADGDAPQDLVDVTRMLSYGGRLLILARGPQGVGAPQLFQYDGAGVSSLASLPASFLPWDMVRYGDLVVISGYRLKTTGVAGTSRSYVRPALYSYVSGSISLLWQADDFLPNIRNLTPGFAAGPGIAAWRDGCVFHDEYTDALKYYDSGSGGIATVSEGSFLSSGNGSLIVAAPDYVLTFDIPNAGTPWQLDSGTLSQLDQTTLLG